MIKTLKKYRYLLARLVQRDFIQKYKKTSLGVLWSVLSPLCEFAVLMLIFKNIFGRDMPHFTIYMLIGVLSYNYYSGATTSGMQSFLFNAGIMQKIKLPTWLFPLSKNISATINFLITSVILVVYMFIDRLPPNINMIWLLYPFVLFFFFNLGVSLILASLYVFFKDVQYLYQIFNRLLYFCCAVFWTPDRLSTEGQKMLMINPVYDFISYGRSIILYGEVPSMEHHLILLGYTVLVMVLGVIIYYCNRKKFVFYL